MSCSWGTGSKRKLLSKESSCLIPGSPHSHGSPKPPERPTIIPGAQADWHSPISPCCAGTAAKLVASRHLHTAALGQRRRAVRSRSSLRLAGGDPVRDKKGPDPLAQVLQHTGCQGNGDLMFLGGLPKAGTCLRGLAPGQRAHSASAVPVPSVPCSPRPYLGGPGRGGSRGQPATPAPVGCPGGGGRARKQFPHAKELVPSQHALLKPHQPSY